MIRPLPSRIIAVLSLVLSVMLQARGAAPDRLLISVKGQGSVEVSGGPVAAGSPVTLQAVPENGWRFDRWEGGLSGVQNPSTLTVAGTQLVVAVFVQGVDAEIPGGLAYYAVFDWLVDDEQLKTGIDKATISGDGKKIFFSNGDGKPGTRKGWSMNADGSELTEYRLPDPGEFGAGPIKYVVTNETGSRTFFIPPYDRAFFKLENGQLSKISIDMRDGPGGIDDPGTNTAGSSLCFLGSAGSRIWRVDHDGGHLESIVYDREVPCIGGTGEGIGNVAAAADGHTIAFIMGVRNRDNNTRSTEVFCLQAGKIFQLTDDRKGSASKGGLIVSGDGSTVVYMDSAAGKYLAIAPNRTNFRAVAAVGGNAGMVWKLTHDGQYMIWSDGASSLGRRIKTDGTEAFDLLPGWNVTLITLALGPPMAISKDGNHILFRFEYAQWPFKRCLYLGHLNDALAVAGAPKIDGVTFEPSKMPRDVKDAKIRLTAMLEAAPENLAAVSITHVVDGKIEGRDGEMPVWFPLAPADDGKPPDAKAGDMIHTAVGQQGGKIKDIGSMRVRIALKDKNKTIVVADAILNTGP